jgi:hypothetical protein
MTSRSMVLPALGFCLMARIAHAGETLPTALICDFEQQSYFLWDGNNWAAKPKKPGTALHFTLTAIDPKAGTAQAMADIGVSTEHVIQGQGALSFVEVTGMGFVNVTMVSLDHKTSADQYRATLTRQINQYPLPGEMLVASYTGVCRRPIGA